MLFMWLCSSSFHMFNHLTDFPEISRECYAPAVPLDFLLTVSNDDRVDGGTFEAGGKPESLSLGSCKECGNILLENVQHFCRL